MDWAVLWRRLTVALVAVATVRLLMSTLHHSMERMRTYANLVVDYVRESWLVWQMVHGFVYYCCALRLVIDISVVCVHSRGSSVDCHSMQCDDWIAMVNSSYLDCRYRCHHCTGMFHIHNMWMSVADDHDYSNQRSVLSVANDNADGADCNWLYWYTFDSCLVLLFDGLQ